MGNIDLWPIPIDSWVGPPSYYAFAIYDDENMSSLIDYRKLSRPTKDLKEIHVMLKTIKEMIDDGSITDWANGKYLDKSGAVVYVSYPKVVAYYEKHYATVEFVEEQNPNAEPYGLDLWQLSNLYIDGKKQKNDSVFGFSKAFDLNNNELLVECCYFGGFIQEFLKRIGVNNPSYDPCYGLFKGVKR